jgi:hypothetical protein
MTSTFVPPQANRHAEEDEYDRDRPHHWSPGRRDRSQNHTRGKVHEGLEKPAVAASHVSVVRLIAGLAHQRARVHVMRAGRPLATRARRARRASALMARYFAWALAIRHAAV